MKLFISALVCAAATLLFLLTPPDASAFWTRQAEDRRLELRGTLNGGLGIADYPDDNFIYTDSDEVLWNGDFRLLCKAVAGEIFGMEINLLQNVRSTPAVPLPGSRAAQQEVERSSFFFWQQEDSNSTQASLSLDSGSFSLNSPSAELTIGRQPINLAVAFYFTPNDFFAPFAPLNFYREYKPGVDALRYEKRLADLTQFTLLGVLGYTEDPDSDSGWSRAPDWQRTSLVGRLTHILGDYELGFLGGILPGCTVQGLSLQGDVFPWLGIRAEGNYRDTWSDNLRDGLQLSIGLEHRFSSRLIARLEQMYNGTGYHTIDEAGEAVMAGTPGTAYLGRNYTAFDFSYEFTPLLTCEFLYLRNWTDYSQSYSFYGLYSLSNEAELALTMSFPRGEEPDFQSPHSEFGLLPTQITLEYRLYF